MFVEIAKHLGVLKLNITIQESPDAGKIVVSVQPTYKNGDKAVNRAIPPFTIKGTPQEVEDGFAVAFNQAAILMTDQSTDMEKWAKEAAEASKKSEAGKKLKEEEDKKKKILREKADKDIKLGDAQFKEKKYANAKLYYRQALTTLGTDAALQKKIDECEKLSGGGGLFASSEPEPTIQLEPEIELTQEDPEIDEEEPKEDFDDTIDDNEQD